MDSATQVQYLEKAVYISHHANKLEIDMNPTILSQVWVNSRKDWALSPCYGNQSRRKIQIQTTITLLKN